MKMGNQKDLTSFRPEPDTSDLPANPASEIEVDFPENWEIEGPKTTEKATIFYFINGTFSKSIAGDKTEIYKRVSIVNLHGDDNWKARSIVPGNKQNEEDICISESLEEVAQAVVKYTEEQNEDYLEVDFISLPSTDERDKIKA